MLKDAAPVLKIPITCFDKFIYLRNYGPWWFENGWSTAFEENDELKPGNYLFEFQLGFRSSYSTDTCLIHVIDHIKSHTAKGLFTGLVLLDIRKAFDNVDHIILCKNNWRLLGYDSYHGLSPFWLTENKLLV